MQGAQKLRSEAYSHVRCNDEVEAQRSRWIFYPIFVIPAKAGIQLIQAVLSRLGGTASAGVTAFLTFYEIIKPNMTRF